MTSGRNVYSVRVTLGLLTLLAACIPAQSQGVTWSPGWTTGKYWVVKSEERIATYDPVSGDVGWRPGGQYLTRFRVREVVQFPAGGGRVTLEIKWKVDGRFSYDDNPEVFEIDFALSNLQVSEFRSTDLRSDGNVTTLTDTIPRESYGLAPFWLYTVLPHMLPENLVIALPLLGTSQSQGGYVLESRAEERLPSYRQSVSVGGGGVVSVALEREGAHIDGRVLEFRPGMPWYDVRMPDGTLVNEVVETGTLP